MNPTHPPCCCTCGAPDTMRVRIYTPGVEHRIDGVTRWEVDGPLWVYGPDDRLLATFRAWESITEVTA